MKVIIVRSSSSFLAPHYLSPNRIAEGGGGYFKGVLGTDLTNSGGWCGEIDSQIGVPPEDYISAGSKFNMAPIGYKVKPIVVGGKTFYV